jgi:hypothetical protein
MMNKIIYSVYSLLFLTIAFVILSFLMNWIEILETLNKLFYLFGISVFLTTVILAKRLNRLLKYSINSLSFLALITWILCLFGSIEFEKYANFSFISLITLLLISIYLKLILNKNRLFQSISTLSFAFLLIVFWISGKGYFSSNLFTSLSLGLFTLIVITFLIIGKTKCKEN